MSSRAPISALALGLVVATTLRAQSPAVEVGAVGTITRFDRSVGSPVGGGYGARLVVTPGARLPWLQLDLQGTSSAGAEWNVVNFTQQSVRAFAEYRRDLSPSTSVVAGPGVVVNAYSGPDLRATRTTDAGAAVTAGLRRTLLGPVALRVNAVVDYVPRPFNRAPGGTTTNWNGSVQFGVSVLTFGSYAPSAAPSVEVVRAGQPDERGARRTRRDRPADASTSASDRARAGTSDVAARAPASAAASAPAGPDADRDGVPDARDRCADTPGGLGVDYTGCATLFPAGQRWLALDGVAFAPARPLLTEGSLSALDRLARRLLDHPEVRVEILAPPGTMDAHHRRSPLAVQRALAVRAYLVLAGVSGERITVSTLSRAPVVDDRVIVRLVQ